ncbi:MAG: ABC-type transporter, integral rane subunit, partial [Firmicutes bacterium]|nr:ABC-type transporter, integral rane subunit [Bacillota bacterium]
KATPQRLAEVRQEMGLNQPLPVQYGLFLANAARGNFGRSFMTKSLVTEEIRNAVPPTLELSLIGIGLAILVAIPVGVLSATKQYSWFDTGSMTMMLLGVSMPVFWSGLLLMLIFGVVLHWLPLSGVISDRVTLEHVTGIYLLDSVITGNMEAFWSTLQHLILPGITLGLIPLAVISRQTRSSMLEVLQQDYIRTARAKGLGHSRVNYKHALRNALIPVVTVVGLQVGSLLSGAVITETVFARPGMGRLAVQAIFGRDYPLIQGIVLFGAVTVVLINLMVDLLYAYVDPRIHYS